jgi:TRAP-type C4-dicarboxylate transport system substrate-binding protein
VGLEAIGSGVTDLGQLNGDQFKLGTIGYIPFLWNMEQCAWATFNLFNTEVATWDKFGELDNVKILLSTPLQPNQWWGTVDVKTMADLAGKKVRAESALEADTMTALGATPITGLEASDLSSALALGTIDGCFFTYSAWSYGIVDAAKYCTQVNLFPRVYVLAMNKAKYDGLPAEAKTLLDSFCTAAESLKLAKAHDAGQNFGLLITKGIVDMPGDGKIAHPIFPYILPGAELANWKTATAGIKDTWIADMNALGFDGQAMYNRALALAAQTPA